MSRPCSFLEEKPARPQRGHGISLTAELLGVHSSEPRPSASALRGRFRTRGLPVHLAVAKEP